MEPIKKTSAAFHRLRRAYFANKNANDPPIQIEPVQAEEWEPRKGRKPNATKKYPRQTSEEWVKAERKRIFIEEIQRRARLKKPDG